MKKIFVEDIKVNDVLARPVIGKNGTVLLYEGAILKEEIIQKLSENDILTIYIEDSQNSKESSTYNAEQFLKEEISNSFEKIVENKIKFDNDEEFSKILDTAKDVIGAVLEEPEVLNDVIEIKRKSNDIYDHLMTVSTLSTILAIKMGFNETEVRNVALGGLMHDIGLCDLEIPYIDIEIERMPAVDKLNYRKHVIIGYDLIQKTSFVNDTIKTIVLSHHERNDGTGYPFHKISERIDKEVKIVSICDYMDELANGIGCKKRKMYEVIEVFRTHGYKMFDMELLNILTQTVVWFPNGCLVLTNEGETARVIRQNKGFLDRPVIQIVKDASGNEIKKEIIKDLTECLTVFIIDTID